MHHICRRKDIQSFSPERLDIELHIQGKGVATVRQGGPAAPGARLEGGAGLEGGAKGVSK